MKEESIRSVDARINALAFRLCEAWQKTQRRQHGFTIDEIGAFMAGVRATEEEFIPEIDRLRAQLADATDQIVGMHRHVAEYLAEIERLQIIIESAVHAQTASVRGEK